MAAAERWRSLKATWGGKPRVAIEFRKSFGCFIKEASVLTFPEQIDFADRTIALFGDDDLSLAGVLGGGFTAMIVLFAMDEHHDVRILFDRSRFPEVAESRRVVLPFFGLSIELCEAEDGDLLLARENFQSSSDLGDLLLPGISLILWLNQLQVVDDD